MIRRSLWEILNRVRLARVVAGKLFVRALYRTEPVRVSPSRVAYMLQPRPWASTFLRLRRNEIPNV